MDRLNADMLKAPERPFVCCNSEKATFFVPLWIT